MEIKVYDEKGQVVKTCKAEPIDLEFGAIRSIMQLLNIEDVTSTTELLKTVYDAWEQLTRLLTLCFPGMEYKDWEHVKAKELLPVLVDIVKYSFREILTIPKEKN